MDMHFAGQPLKVTVVLVDGNGSTIDSAVTGFYRVTDQNGRIVQDETSIAAEAGVGLVEVDVSAEANALETGEVRGYRMVEVTVTTESGRTFVCAAEYLLEARDTLRVQINSFVSYPNAMIMAAGMTGLDHFLSATRQEQVAALIQSHSTLARLRYRISDRAFRETAQNRLVWSRGEDYVDLRSMGAGEFAELPEAFRHDLATAQLIEANEALDAFSIHRRRQQGMLSETIGESSMMFRSEKILNIPMTRRSLDVLRPYLVWELSIGRG